MILQKKTQAILEGFLGDFRPVLLGTIHTVSSENFRSLSVSQKQDLQWIHDLEKNCYINDESLEVTVVISRFSFFQKKNYENNNCFLWRQIAWEFMYLRLHKFRVLAGDFESIETFAGFVQLLAENWVQTHTKINNQDHIFLAFSKYLI